MRYYQGLIDLDKLKHGQHYSRLGDSFIIFICPFDRFKARHIYTFVQEFDRAVQLVKSNRKAMKEFMPYEMSLLEREQQGLLRGRAEGITKGTEEVAINLFKLGMDLAFIQSATHLSIERIKQLVKDTSV